MEGGRPTVLIVQEWVPQYRRAFFNELRETLDLQGINLRLVQGQPPANRSARADSVTIPWASLVRNRTLDVGSRSVTWQPALAHCRKADLVIVPQNVSLLLGPALLALSGLGLVPPIALWGHGENIEETKRIGLAERLKRRISGRAHWFFAYTAFSASKVETAGFPPERITTVNNSRSMIPVSSDEEVDDELAALLREVASRTGHVGWMISALDGSKRLETLVEAVDEVRRLVPDFEFFVVGSGSGESELREASASRPWLHVVGPRFGADRAALGDLAQVTIHPGLLGLHVIDSFEFRAPIVTAVMPDHSHEVTYLDDRVNARVLKSGSSAASLGAAAVEVLTHRKLLSALQDGCAVSAEMYSLTAMVERFAGGVVSALEEVR